MEADPRHSAAPRERSLVAEKGGAGTPLRFPLADVEHSVGARFAAQVHRYGDRVALRTQSVTLSYRELDTAARRIAGRLIDRLGSEEAPVLLLMKDDVRFASAFLAGLQAGKICVPVDADHPLPWLTTIWRDTGARVLVTDTECLGLARQIAGDARQILNVDDSAADACGGLALPEVSPDRLACILYTSGSSGGPKGVLYTHRTLLHVVLKTTNSSCSSAGDRLSLLAARGTAAEVTGIFGTLLIGAELQPFHMQQASLSALTSWVREQEITVWRLTPSMFRHCLESLPAGEMFPSMRLIRLGGEPAARRELELFRRHFLPGCALSNAYATTETGLIRVRRFDHDTPVASHILPVGYPVPDTEVLLIDESGQPAQPGEIGEIGEIVVCSEYLAVGYWQRPDLTAAAFLPDPEGGRRRLYRTGDLGRLARDGCLEHLGRRDFQVKVRGYRIELAELEAALLQAPAVKAAAVAALDDGRGGNRLVGYVVPTSQVRPTTSSLRAFLKERLPDHMVPSAYVVLERLPVTGAGKVDRSALPPPTADMEGAPMGDEPGTHLQVQLAGIWAEMLKLPRIGLQEDFFDLGGDSLLATEMLHRVEHDCGCRVDPSRVLSSLTIERLATEILAGSRETLAKPVVQIQSGNSRTPFFFLHGDLDSGGFYCRRLARVLGADVTMYAVQPHGMNGTALPDTVEDMAAERLRSIIEIQPTGPYSVGGFCGGGIIAYEMARQLLARGEQVATLLLIDARPPNLAYRSDWTLAQRVGAVLRLSPRTRRALFLRLKWYREELQVSGRTGLLGWTVLLWGKLKAVATRAMAGGVQSGATPAQGAGDEPPSLFSEYQQRMSVYMPGPFPGRVALFRSSYREGRPLAGVAPGWGMLGAREDVHHIPGNHQTSVTTHVADLAARMRPYLHSSRPAS